MREFNFAGVAFLGKLKGAAGEGLSFVGQKLSDASLQVQSMGAGLANHIGSSLTTLPKVPLPSFQAIEVPTVPLETLLQLAKGPHSLESTVR